jgi:uncharacterized protein (TIGR02270 family)
MTTSAKRSTAAAPFFWDIAEESLDEAAFFWGLRDAALLSPDRTPFEIETVIEGRLHGAIDGLAIPDQSLVERLLTPALDSDDPATVTVAAHAALVGGTDVGRERFCAAVIDAGQTEEAGGGVGSRAGDARLAALRRGLQLVPAGQLWIAVAAALSPATTPAAARAAFLDACAFRALPVDVDFGELLAPSAPIELVRAAARLLRHAPARVRAAWLGHALEARDQRARAAALEVGLIWGDAPSLALARSLARTDVVDVLNVSDGWAARADLLWQLAALGSARESDLLDAAAGDARHRRAAIAALGCGGWRAGADLCVELLAQEIEPRLAGEALCAITGLDLRAAGLAVDSAPALDDVPDFQDDDLDADLVPAAELFLPMPDVPGVIRWWNQHRPRFQTGVRYLAGRSRTVDRLVESLQQGPMRRRRALAFELAVRTRGLVQIQSDAFLGEQRRQLAAVGSRAGDGRAVDARDAEAACCS